MSDEPKNEELPVKSPSETTTEAPRAKRVYKRRKPKVEPRDEYGLPTYKGTMSMPTLSADEKRALDTLIFQGTQDSGDIVIPSVIKVPPSNPQARVLPEAAPKTDHVLIKSMKLCKDMKGGGWKIDEVETNHGIFGLGSTQNERLSQHVIRSFAMYLKDVFEEDLTAFIKSDEASQ